MASVFQLNAHFALRTITPSELPSLENVPAVSCPFNSASIALNHIFFALRLFYILYCYAGGLDLSHIEAVAGTQKKAAPPPPLYVFRRETTILLLREGLFHHRGCAASRLRSSCCSDQVRRLIRTISPATPYSAVSALALVFRREKYPSVSAARVFSSSFIVVDSPSRSAATLVVLRVRPANSGGRDN